MASRTYLPKLKFILDVGCKYIARYRNQILAVIGTGHTDELDAVITSCNALVAILDLFIPTGG